MAENSAFFNITKKKTLEKWCNKIIIFVLYRALFVNSSAVSSEGKKNGFLVDKNSSTYGTKQKTVSNPGTEQC